MIDYTTPRFKTSQVAEAAGIGHGTLRAYFSRKQWRRIGKQAEGEGLPNLFSLRDAMAFAVAARLIDATNASPEKAFDIAALKFAFTGTLDRHPAGMFHLYERGETVLIYAPDTCAARIVADDDIKSLSDLVGQNQGRQIAATVIVLNPIEREVFSKLGIEGNSWDDLSSVRDDDTGELVD